MHPDCCFGISHMYTASTEDDILIRSGIAAMHEAWCNIRLLMQCIKCKPVQGTTWCCCAWLWAGYSVCVCSYELSDILVLGENFGSAS